MSPPVTVAPSQRRRAPSHVAMLHLFVRLSAVAFAVGVAADDSSAMLSDAIVATAAFDEGTTGLHDSSTTSSAPSTTSVPGSPSSTDPTPTSATSARSTHVSVDGAASGTTSEFEFLDCVRHRESRGQYRALNPSGAAGAYQLMPGTGRAIAHRAGRHDLAATPVVNWSVADQDLMALLLYRWQGATPWGGSCWSPR